jgi:hypothetical protein
MADVKQEWESSGSSGGLAAVQLRESPAVFALYCSVSTLATTQSFSLQTAAQSSGPWVSELSTQMTTAASTRYVLRGTGPLGEWVRPYLHTAATGTYYFGVE